MLEILATTGIGLSMLWGSAAAIYLGPAVVWRVRTKRELRAKAAHDAEVEQLKSVLKEQMNLHREIKG